MRRASEPEGAPDEGLPHAGPGAETGVPGGVPLASFPGTSWDARFAAALSHVAAQTYKPVILLPNGPVELSGGPYTLIDGLRLSGPLGAPEREFDTRGPQSIVTVRGGPLFAVPPGGVRGVSIRGVQFRAAAPVDWLVRQTDLANGPIMSDCDFTDLAWNGFSSVMHTRHLRVAIERTYVNNGGDVQFKLGGSDNTYWMSGHSFLSGNAPATATAYLHFTSMSRTRVGPLYITPQHATAIKVERGYGGLSFHGLLLDSTGRDADTACQGPAVVIDGGEGHVFQDCWFFNNAVRPRTTGRPWQKGQVYIHAGSQIAFIGCQWSGGARQRVLTPRGTPAIYAAAGVTDVRVHAPLAPNAGERLLHQAAPGTISCDDPTWTVATA
ncbi:hypothetical protein AB0J52_34470 [Spirillospora sp. NPDC049652]